MGETELSSVEGQRVMQVLDETLNATRLISCVTPDLRSRSANITDMVGPEVTDLLLAHVDLLEEYEGALAKCGGEPKSNDMVDVTLRLQDSVRTLSRLPGRYPGLVDKLMVMAMDTDMQRVVTRGVHILSDVSNGAGRGSTASGLSSSSVSALEGGVSSTTGGGEQSPPIWPPSPHAKAPGA